MALVRADRYPQRCYGDRVLVEGLLETPPVFEEFSYREYLARQGIHSLIRYVPVTLLAENQASPILYHLFAFKRYAQSTIASILPEPQAALLTGILLGVETGIPRWSARSRAQSPANPRRWDGWCSRRARGRASGV